MHLFAVSIRITSDTTTPVVGESYSLTCDVTGANVITYLWTKDNVIPVNETSQVLPFPTLKLSQAGQYSCEVNVSSDTYRASQNVSIHRM